MVPDYVHVLLLSGVMSLIPLTFYARRAYLNYQARLTKEYIAGEAYPAAAISLSMTLGILISFSLLIKPAPLWLHLFQIEGFIWMFLLNYSVNIWLTYNKLYQFSRSRLTYVVVLLTICTSVLAYLSKNNYGHIFANDPIKPTLLYLAYYGISVLTSLTLQILIIRLFTKSIVNSRDLTYVIRRSIGLLVMLCVAVGTGSALLSVILFVLHSDVYRHTLSALFSLVGLLTVIPLTNMVSQSALEKISAPIEAHIQQRKQEEHKLLQYLHQQMTHVAPHVVLHQSALYKNRIPIELSHARQVVWSYTLRKVPTSAKYEAKHIHALLLNENIIEKSGPYSAPRTWRRSERKHFAAIARHLIQLQHQRQETPSYES